MKRALYLLFPVWLFILTPLSEPCAYAQPVAAQVTHVEQLPFTPMQHDKNLAVAQDGQGRTWVRGQIPPELRDIPIILQIPSARIHDYQLYLQQDGAWTPLPRNTDSRSGHFKGRFPQYALTTSDSLYYLALDQHPPQTLQVHLSERTRFSNDESAHLLRIGLYYGLALMSVVFNIVFYLIFKDKRFSTYCILLFTTFLSFFYEDGMFYYLSDGRLTMDYFPTWNSSVTAITSLTFTYYFLGLEAVLRPYIKVYLVASAMLLLGALIYTLTGEVAVANLVSALCFPFAIACLYLAIRRFKKDVYARFLVISFSLVVLTGIGYTLYTRVDSSTFAFFDISTFRLVSSVEIICISFAIIFKMRSLQEENERYRAELSTYLRKLETAQPNNGQSVGKNGYVKAVFPSQPKQRVVENLKKQYDLTEREIDVLLCIWDGLTNKEIADRLCITVSTTKYHVSNLYVKLDVKNRNQVQVLGKTQWVPSN